MNKSRTSARVAGVLLILGTVPILAAMMLWGKPLSSPDYLSLLALNSGQILLLACTVLVMGLACAGIGISLYPVLIRRNESLAMTAMGFRIMEGILQVVSAALIVALLALSREYIKAGGALNSFYQSAGTTIKAVNEWLSAAYLFPFYIGAFSYYLIFYRARLVPRWLSAWGLTGILLMLVSSLAGIAGLVDSSSPFSALLCFPILVQELVLALWLIIKGFDDPETAKEQVR